MLASPLTHPAPLALNLTRAAIAYETMAHTPHSFPVELSYLHFKHETLRQFSELTAYVTEHFISYDAYSSSAEMHDDIDRGQLYTRLTVASGDAETMPTDHPMLASTPFRNLATGEPLLLNDVFRAVHDVNGHYGTEATEHFSFGPKGEENAWLRHRQLYSREALPALWCETRGQSAWTNAFGDHASRPLAERPFATQKAGLPANYRELV